MHEFTKEKETKLVLVINFGLHITAQKHFI